MFQITAPLFSSRLFEYGPDAGDQELQRNLDVAKKINLIYPLRFYGVNTSTVYVSCFGRNKPYRVDGCNLRRFDGTI